MLAKPTGHQSANSAELLRFGPLTLNLQGFSVSVDGQDVALTYAEFLLLATLTRNPYSVMERSTLVEALNQQSAGRRTIGASERGVDTHIARLRRKLAAAGCDCIRTMRNVGYRFVPPQDT